MVKFVKYRRNILTISFFIKMYIMIYMQKINPTLYNVLKVRKPQNDFFLSSITPKNQQKCFPISALASKKMVKSKYCTNSQCYKLAILIQNLVLTFDYWKQLNFAYFLLPKAVLCLKKSSKAQKTKKANEGQKMPSKARTSKNH